MTPSLGSAARTPLLVAITIAALALGSPAAADAYWIGLRSDDWNDGIENGVSNWYDEPSLAGTAQKVPRDTAIFANGAINFTTVVRKDAGIKRIRFDASAPIFTIEVASGATLSITGFGISNQSNNSSALVLASGGRAIFGGKAKITGTGNVRSMNFYNAGSILFIEGAKGGDATVHNSKGGKIAFQDKSSAVGMAITNLGGTISFLDESGGEGVRILNSKGSLEVSRSGKKAIKILNLTNDDEVILDRSSITLGEGFLQTGKGKLKLYASKDVPVLQTVGQARLDGELWVIADEKTKPGTYKVIVAGTSRDGEFRKLRFSGSNKLKAKLVADGKEVLLVLKAK